VARERRNQIHAVLHTRRRRSRRNRAAAIGVNREAEDLGVGIVLSGVIEELIEIVRIVCVANPLEIPAGKHTSARVDVGLDELADADCEQFHDLARKVFLRPRSRVEATVQPDEHCRISGDFNEQIAEVWQRVITEQLQLTS
jgi:hypothetical protein